MFILIIVAFLGAVCGSVVEIESAIEYVTSGNSTTSSNILNFEFVEYYGLSNLLPSGMRQMYNKGKQIQEVYSAVCLLLTSLTSP